MLQKREISPVSREQALGYAARLAETECGMAGARVKYVGGGSFGFVFRAQSPGGGAVILKACRTAGMAAREANDLAVLREAGAIRMPRVYFTRLADESVPLDFICMEHLEGTNCFTDFSKLLCSSSAKRRFASELAAAARRWHTCTNDKFGLLQNAVYGSWLAYYRPFAEDILSCARALTAEGTLEARVTAVMESAMRAFETIFSEPVQSACLIHGDLNVMNVLSDRRLRNLAVIDPLESKWADPEYELFQLRNLTGERFHLYETYKANYPVSAMCDAKTAFYGLYHEVYAYIVSGVKVDFILNPLVKRMRAQLDALGLRE